MRHKDNQHDNLNILITGGGLIGGTLALDYASKLKNPTLTVYEINNDAARNLQRQFIEHGIDNINVITTEEELIKSSKTVDLVDHCVPIDAIANLQRTIADHLKSGTVVTNRGSAQAFAGASISPFIDRNRNIYHFGVHPVVGRERKPGSPLEIHAETFENQIAIMEPLSQNASGPEKRAHARIKFINNAIGFNVKTLPPHIHDQLLGALSHENTLGLQTLVNTRGEIRTGLGATMMRASSGTTAMWSPIHQFNSAAVSASNDIQQAQLKNLRTLLEENNEQRVIAYISQANSFRSEWNDTDTNVESLETTFEEVNASTSPNHSADATSQIALPLAVSIARTLGIKESVNKLEKDLAQYGHKYVDLLNSSARDSTLAARYNPEEVASIFISYRQELLVELERFASAQNQIVHTAQNYSERANSKDNEDLKAHINKATSIMANEQTPDPRKTNAGQGFEAFRAPIPAHTPAREEINQDAYFHVGTPDIDTLG